MNSIDSSISRLPLSPRSSYSGDDLRPQSAPGLRMSPIPPPYTSRPATATGTLMSHRGRPQSVVAHHIISSKARPKSAVGHLATKPLVASKHHGWGYCDGSFVGFKGNLIIKSLVITMYKVCHKIFESGIYGAK